MLNRLISGILKEDELKSATNYPAVNTNAVVTITANSVRAHYLARILWSYDADPIGGRITVEDGAANIIRDFSVIRGGPGALPFSACKGSNNTAMIVTLYSGGGAVTGKLTIEYITRA